MGAENLTAQEIEDCLALNPFDGDFGSPGDTVFADRICLARKPTACNDCTGPIMPGEQQRRLDAKFDDAMRSYRWCIHCCRAMALSWDDDGAAMEERWALRERAASAAHEGDGA